MIDEAMRARMTPGGGARRRLGVAALLAGLALLGAGAARAETAVEVTAGASHTCARTTFAGVRCWGANGDGQLGSGTTTRSLVPIATSGLPEGAVAIAAGARHTCALTPGGGVRCWGYNQYGQLGNASTLNSSLPVAASGLASGVARVAAGAHHGCALTTVGSVWCWGLNGSGQLGSAVTPISSVPVAVTGLSGVAVAIAAGGFHSCALLEGGGVACWGYNEFGQLGDASTTDRDVPVTVVGLPGAAIGITAGAYHTCALTEQGSVWCWGLNDSGQLGDLTNTDRSVPVATSGLQGGAAAIAAGDYHTCALVFAGGARCWGLNGSGQLGSGTTANSNVPVEAGVWSGGVGALAGGGFHSCALTTSGGLQCWGYGQHGQLGNASTASSSVPVWVIGFLNTLPALGASAQFLLAAALVLVGASWVCRSSRIAVMLGPRKPDA